MRRRQVLQLRRLGSALLWDELRGRPRVPQLGLLVVWKSRRALLLGRQRHKSLCSGLDLQQHHLVERPVRSVWRAWRALLRWQRMLVRMLFQR